MKKFFVLTLQAIAVFSVAANVFAFSDVETHPKITQAAARQSLLKTDSYLNQNLGFKDGYGEIISSGLDIETLLMNGAHTEDSGTLPSSGICFRGLDHFYDPLTQQGLDEWTNIASLDIKFLLPAVNYLTPIHWQGHANYFWAEGDYDATTDIKEEPSPSAQKSKEANEYSWKRAREAFIAALISKTENKRNQLFARTFRSVGQVTHLLQDMAVPAHVRNDMKGHLYYQKYLNYKFRDDGFSAWIGNNFEAYVAGPGSCYIKSGGEVASFTYLRDFWDEGVYEMSRNIDNTGLGLSEYTSANFLSSHRMLNSYPHPSEDDGSVVIDQVPSEDGKTDTAHYFKMEKGEAKVNHLAHSSILGKYGIHFLDYLDDTCHEDYARYLAPKAVDYSTGLINYFFRGTLEITTPNRFVYSIADGGLDPQEFTYIKAKVRNSTDYNGYYNGGGDSPMGPGKLWAIAKYKKRTNYDPNLTNDPPTADDREDHFSYSVSAPINGANLSPDTPQEFNFNFSGDPIPAGITDLYLQVVYQGTLGNELNTAVAVGMKDLSEPTHLGFFNNADYMYFKRPCLFDESGGCVSQGNKFTTPEAIVEECQQNDFCERPINCDPQLNPNDPGVDERLNCTEGCGYPIKIQVQIAFYPPDCGPPNPLHVSYNNMPAGRYGRVLLLSDSPLKASFAVSPIAGIFPWIDYGLENFPCDIQYFPTMTESNFDVPVATYQDDPNGSFVAIPDIKEFRGVLLHSFEFILASFIIEKPPMVKDAAWPLLENPTAIEIGSNNINP